MKAAWHTGEAESAIRVGKYKLRKDLDSLEMQLFDISEDLGEKRDLSHKLPEVVRNLERQRVAYLNIGFSTVQQQSLPIVVCPG